MSSNDLALDAAGDVRDLARPYSGDVERREPPGEAFPPYMGLVGTDEGDSVFERFLRDQSRLASTIRSYVGMLAQRDAPQNEQVYQSAGILVNGGPLDLDLGQIPLNLFLRLHRIVVTGTPADVPTLSLYLDGAGAVGSALATYNLGALNADGLAMIAPDDLNVPKGRRLIARMRAGTSVNPIYVAAFGRAYPA